MTNLKVTGCKILNIIFISKYFNMIAFNSYQNLNINLILMSIFYVSIYISLYLLIYTVVTLAIIPETRPNVIIWSLQ